MCEVSCECALRCFSTLTTEQRRTIFTKFWALCNFDIQNTYLCGCVKVLPVARHYTSESKRGNTRVYYVNNGERSVRICKTAFLRIHGISHGRLSRVLAGQAEQGGLPKLDTRERHEPPNKTSEEDKAFIRQHIESFPVYESHYSRSDNPHRRYLSPDLSQAKMYHLYKEKCNENGCRPVSDWVYRKTFCEEFNLSFGRYVTYADNTHTSHPPTAMCSQPTHFILAYMHAQHPQCMHTAAYTHTHAHTHAHTRTRTHTRTHTYTHTHTHTHTRTHTHMHTHAHTHAHTRTHTHTQHAHTRTHARIHTRRTHARTHAARTHTHTHAHTHAYTHAHTRTHTRTQTHTPHMRMHSPAHACTHHTHTAPCTHTACTHMHTHTHSTNTYTHC